MTTKLVTICDVANHVLGREASTGEDFEEAGVPMFGGCASCAASIAAYNAHPGRAGYLLCGDCADESNAYTSVDEAVAAMWPEEEVH